MGDAPFTTWHNIFPLPTLTGCVSKQADGWLPKDSFQVRFEFFSHSRIAISQAP